MGSSVYSEPMHVLYDWQAAQAITTDRHHKIIYEAESQCYAYSDRPDIQQDIAQTALSQLIKPQTTEEPPADNVRQLRRDAAVAMKTVYLATRFDTATGKQLPAHQASVDR